MPSPTFTGDMAMTDRIAETVAERAAQTARALEEAAREAKMFISGDGRISEADCGRLLGYSVAYLKNMRSEGKGPQAFRVGMNGCRLSYRLIDVAMWVESNREF